jgi:iron complex outermembrane receptor protein
MVTDYTNTGYKNEISPYAKGEIKIDRFSLFGDIQYRYNVFSYDGSEPFESIDYSFLNWSAGATLRMSSKQIWYFSMGKVFREPTRTDLFGGWDNYDPASFTNLKPESVVDTELGYKFLDTDFTLKANMYFMNFTNEIVLNGKLGPNAILLHQNVENSFRTGVEVDLRYKWYNGFEVKGNANFSYNQITDQSQTFSPVLTPAVILNGDVIYNLKKQAYFGVNLRHNSLSYIDLSNDTTLPRFSVLNAYAGVNWKGMKLQLNANNLLNDVILTNGVIGFDYVTPKYFVMAGTNMMATLIYEF